MDSLEAQWEKFTLSEVEGDTIDLVSTTEQPKSYLAAKFLTRRVLNAEAVAHTFTPLWRTDHGFTIRDMNDNILVFVFEDEADRERVMMGEPWAYDKHLVVLQRIEEEEAIDDVVFQETSLWVQLHGLPIRRMNPEVATTLVSSLGRIEQISDGDTNADGGQAMRIHIRLDLRAVNERPWRKTEIKVEGICKPAPRKQPKTPSTQKANPIPSTTTKTPYQTRPTPPPQSTTDQFTPYTEPTLPPEKTTTPTPLSPKAPPPTMVVTIFEKENDGLTSMDVEENPGFHPYFAANHINGETIFEQELRDIDVAIGFTPQSPVGLSMTPNSNFLPPTLTPTPHALPKSPRALGDITNTVQTHPKTTKSHTGKKSWKKLARANADQTDIQSGPFQGKRLSSSMEEEVLFEASLKKQREVFYNPISAEAVEQPRLQEIARLVRAQDPSVVFLIETWQDDGPLERLRCQLHFENKFVASSRNKGGGLCLFWKAEVKLRMQSFSHSHIDAIVNENQPDAWRLTGFYGALETHLREESWTLLRRLSSQFNLPWCCLGDFNELIRVEEKQGRIRRYENQMQRFRDVLDDCGFIDLGYTT
uniref:Uncharacterized protein n=1 Tax=Fagus sylvatica TaxID=28930 RepID=A0A2N9IMV6_FAGSY